MRLTKAKRKRAQLALKQVLAERGIVVRRGANLYGPNLTETLRFSASVHELAHLLLLDLRGWKGKKRIGYIAERWKRTTSVSQLSKHLDGLSFRKWRKEELLAVAVQAQVLRALNFRRWSSFGTRSSQWFEGDVWKKNEILKALKSRAVVMVASQILSTIMEAA